jgi:adenine-specific DNA-methyltransferase
MSGARVDLNPHQVDAALFAIRSPLSKGAVLADEVGLGKTIEAGLVIAQRWAERRRRILLILPATLRKQWQQELEEKFAIPSLILEGKIFNELRRSGRLNPFESERVVACSYHFAAAKADEVRRVPWDLVVMDEAHRLRNVYRSSSRMAPAIVDATAHTPKLLLTATPLQNSLMELYGLVSVIDPHVFGDAASFRDQFVRATNQDERNARLRQRLRPIATRTLRKQVLEYVRFTQRVPLTQDFIPTDEEQRLYDEVSEYLRREALLALPSSQRALMTLVLRKLLASSTFAIAGTLRRLADRLERVGEQVALDEEDYEALDELEDEWDDNPDTSLGLDPVLLRDELQELRQFAELAESISHNAKGQALLSSLQTAFSETERLGAARKAVIFTESRRTQQYLFELLSTNGYAGEIVLINGTNSDPVSREMYENWRERHAGTATLSGSRSADMKAALVEEFRDRGMLLIATESAAEGVNLQFCSLVVNYDLPWNPQRIEQRIGRCHRYGQKHDVVVVNFLNRRNAADQRVFQLLSEKFRLFDGIFGASDEVLGALESGVDLEKRIGQVYQECRTAEEIQTAFDALQAELEEEVSERMASTRELLLDNFDEEVHARLKVNRDRALTALSERQQWLLALTRHELDGSARFSREAPSFHYDGSLADTGWYDLDWRRAEELGHAFYHQEHPLAQQLLVRALERELPVATVCFDYSGHGSVISVVQALVGTRGWMELSRLTVDSLETEEFLVLAGQSDDGSTMDAEICRKLVSVGGRILTGAAPGAVPDGLGASGRALADAMLGEVDARNAAYFDEEVDKLDHWADDLKYGLEAELRELDREIRETRRSASAAVALAEKLTVQKQMKALEQKRSRKRRELYDAQDAIDVQRDELIAKIEGQLQQKHDLEPVWRVRWVVE